MLRDAVVDAERFTRDLRARMVAQNPRLIPSLFPEWVPADVRDKAQQQAYADAQGDDFVQYAPDEDEGIEWEVPTDERENEELERWVAERQGKASAKELTEGGWI